MIWSIWDLDGTLCDVDHRLHLVREKRHEEFHRLCYRDDPREAEVALLEGWIRSHPSHRVAILSGRHATQYATTYEWLHVNVSHFHVPPHEIYLRHPNDHRPSEVFKRLVVETVLLAQGRRIAFAVDDTPKIVRMYQELGIPALRSMSHQDGDYNG